MNGRRVWQIPDWDMLLWRNESTTRAAVMRRGCFVGAVHRVPRPGLSRSGALLASWPPSGIVPTSPRQKSAMPARRL